jgi:endonuclease/exonuclease/phosphatase family metal-dependent hydrolase
MKRAMTLWGGIVGGIVSIFLLFILFSWGTEWRPKALETVYEGERGGGAPLPDTLTVLTWNIGYGGLGDDMDFFMDGGIRTRTSRERTEENLEEIGRFLAGSDADILLLQEVDRDSRRSYGIDQLARLREILPEYHVYFALNYRSPFVPIPLRAPLGRVESGVAVLSKARPEQVIRYQYDSRFSFPVRLFNLKRCWLAVRYGSAAGDEMWVSVTHNTAYDTGEMRTTEANQLYRWLDGRSATLVGGDWNQNPPGYTPSAAEVDDPHFSPQPIPENPEFQYAFDSSTPTVRYLYEPLTGNTTTSVIDFFLLSKNVECLSVNTIDLGFRNSDHNPVVIRVRIP